MKRMKNEEVTEKMPELTHLALGTFQDANGKWVLAKVRYNPETGDTGEFEAVTNEEGSREAINFKFRIEATNNKLVG